jgi:uncharacterized PurR-regulated membrane protein YhhQ (DUF165 family)
MNNLMDNTFSIVVVFLTIGSLISISISHVLLFLTRRKEIILLQFSILCIIITLPLIAISLELFDKNDHDRIAFIAYNFVGNYLLYFANAVFGKKEMNKMVFVSFLISLLNIIIDNTVKYFLHVSNVICFYIILLNLFIIT